MMLAMARSTFAGGGPPGGVAAANRLAQWCALATQPATALLSVLKVASVEVSVPFGVNASTLPTPVLHWVSTTTRWLS